MADPTLQSVQSVLEKWVPLAADAAEAELAVPVSVLMGESLDLAFFVAERWEPVSGKDARPGLKVAVASGLIEETISQDIRELVMAVSHAHAQYRAVTASTLEAPVERGEFLLTEIRQCLEFLFDDGVSDEQDAELARLTETHSDVSSHDALAMSLEGFAFYANKFRDRLAALPDFEAAFIDEALVVASQLRAQSAIKLSSSAVERQTQELALRNRLVTLLLDRVSRARRAARFVFRHYPDVARQVGSAYERRRRARLRAREKAEKVPAPAVPNVPRA